MAIEVDVEMLQLGDVILIDIPEQGANIEAQVVGESPEIVRARTSPVANSPLNNIVVKDR